MCVCVYMNAWRVHLQLVESCLNPVKNLSRANLKINRLIFHRKVFSSIPFVLSYFYFLCARFIVSRGERGGDPNIRKVDYKYRVTPVFRAWLTEYINHFVAKCKAPHCNRRYAEVTKLILPPKLSAPTALGKDACPMENSRGIAVMGMSRVLAWQSTMDKYSHVEVARHARLIIREILMSRPICSDITDNTQDTGRTSELLTRPERSIAARKSPLGSKSAVMFVKSI